MINFAKYIDSNNKIKKNFQKDEEGRAIINVSIKDKQEVLSPFCCEQKETINEEFAGHLDNMVKSLPPKQMIKLSIKCENISNEEKTVFTQATKNYYENKLLDCQLRAKKSLFLFSFCVLLAILSFGLLFICHYFNAPAIINELVDILVWVFVWEATDIIVFKQGSIRLERTRFNALYNSLIVFE